jgi:hypothetical protein
LAFWHPYLLSSGHHGHANGESKAVRMNRTMIAVFELLDRHGASLVVAAHDHNYEQFSRHDSEGLPNPLGMRSFVVGTGGGPLRRSTQPSRWSVSEAYRDDTHGVLRIDLFPRRYEWDFLPADGFPDIDLPVSSDVCADRVR